MSLMSFYHTLESNLNNYTPVSSLTVSKEVYDTTKYSKP